MVKNGTGNARPMAIRRRGGGRKEEAERKQRRKSALAVRALICAVILAGLTVMRTAFPEQTESLRGEVEAWIGAEQDYKAVFSAIGRAVSGEGDARQVMDQIYIQVFGGEEQEAVPVIQSAMLERETGLLSEGNQEPQAVLLNYLWQQEAAPEERVEERVEEEPPVEEGFAFSVALPLQGTVSSAYGPREHPIESGEKFHYGLDIAANEGAEILAFADGTVTAAGESTSFGRYLMMEHGDGVTTLYAHCSSLAVSAGTEVSCGQKIAEVGQTGMATGPHLHFELQQNGEYLDPAEYLEGLG